MGKSMNKFISMTRKHSYLACLMAINWQSVCKPEIKEKKKHFKWPQVFPHFQAFWNIITSNKIHQILFYLNHHTPYFSRAEPSGPITPSPPVSFRRRFRRPVGPSDSQRFRWQNSGAFWLPEAMAAVGISAWTLFSESVSEPPKPKRPWHEVPLNPELVYRMFIGILIVA